LKVFSKKTAVVLIMATFTGAMWAADEYGTEDSPAIKPVIETKDLKLPDLWQQNILPQYQVRVARDVVIAARKMAFDKLVSGVADIKLGDDMTVGTLLARSDEPGVKPAFFVRGVRENGIIYRQDSLIVEITMEVSRKSILGSIKCWLENHLSREDQKYVIKLRDHIESLRGEELRAFGVAAVDIRYVKAEYAAAHERAAQLILNVPSWVAEIMTVRGQAEIKKMAGDPQKGRDEAFEDATDNARKVLLAKINELKETGGMTVGQVTEGTPEMKAGMEALMKSVQVVKGTEVIIGDRAEVIVSLDLKKVWNMLLHYRLTH
jgi:hypothetical protein